MKTFLIIAAFFISAFSLSSCGPGAYVEARPSDVIYSRPAAPGAGYIWIDGDWIWSGGGYRWNEGRWDMARPGRVWHGGSWSQGRRGYRWNRGHW